MESDSTSSAAITEEQDVFLPVEIPIPPSLRFLLDAAKSVAQHPLTCENYLFWSAKVLQIFSASGYSNFLNPNLTPSNPSIISSTGSSPNPIYAQWRFVDQNLIALLHSLISPPILPYVLGLPTSASIWESLSKRFQSSNRTRILQFKTSLQQQSMKTNTMQVYLQELKGIPDHLAAAGSPTSVEDVILYALNGLPATYNAFKTVVRNRPGNLSLDDLYAMLCSEELHLAQDASLSSPAPFALLT